MTLHDKARKFLAQEFTEEEVRETLHPNRIITQDDLEERYEIGKSAQNKLRSERKIPFLKIGGFIRYNTKTIEDWFEDNRVEVA